MILYDSIVQIPKAELHVHLEATLKPKKARELAFKHGITLPNEIFLSDEQFASHGYYDFIQVYDTVAQVVRTGQDYYDLTYDYLVKSHELGSIYTELTISPSHAAKVGLIYSDMLAGVVQGIDDAQKDCGIESRIIIVFVRHYGEEYAEQIEDKIFKYLHPYVVGVGLAGLESSVSAQIFTKAFIKARQIGLYCTAHAGEASGAESIWDVLQHLPIQRIGHGVRSVEDPYLLTTLRKKNIALELCITSNIVTGIYKNYQEHPFLKLYKSGISLSLNSDDPAFFNSSIVKEYAIVRDVFGLNELQLIQLTYNAVEHSFAQQNLKKKLLENIKKYSICKA